MSELRDAIMQALNLHMGRVLDVAAVGIPTPTQYDAFRNIVLNEFGQQGFLPELDALLKRYGLDREGRADTARKGVPR